MSERLGGSLQNFLHWFEYSWILGIKITMMETLAQMKLRTLNEKEYARQHKSEKIHFVFHGGCLSCVTPLHYGLGNCLGCVYFNSVTSKFPDLGIRDLTIEQLNKI